MNKKKAIYALGMLVFLGCASLLLILAADEQRVMSSGSPASDRIALSDLIAHGPGTNRHIELADFYFGKQYIYSAKLVQFKDVYVPVFAKGQPESGSNLRLLVWIRNDRNSNQRLIESEPELDQLVAQFNRYPATISGVLQKPTAQVRTLTAEAYPGTDPAALQVLWARNFPEQKSINILWAMFAVCLALAIACGIAYRRIPRPTGTKASSNAGKAGGPGEWAVR
jgi:hypothetical protein